MRVAVDEPGAYPTIGAALLDAPDDAVISLAAGNYQEPSSWSAAGSRSKPTRPPTSAAAALLAQLLHRPRGEVDEHRPVVDHGEGAAVIPLHSGGAATVCHPVSSPVVRPGPPAPGDPVWTCPRPPARLAGRSAELAAVTETSDVLVVDGVAGVGKNALALAAAHRLADRYPDGRLFLDLRTHSRQGPVDTANALGRLLRAVGTPSCRNSERVDVTEQAGQWRSALPGRRVLLILDDAASLTSTHW